MSEERRSVSRRGMVLSILVLVTISLSVMGSADTATNQTSFEYKVQEDPYFTFAYPAEMIINSTSEQSRNVYHLTDNKDDPITYLISSADNEEGAPLRESALAEIGKTAIASVIDIHTKKDLMVGKPAYKGDTNVSSYSVTYFDPLSKTLISDLVVSTDESIITGILTEPAEIADTPYGSFILQSLFSITPRNAEGGFTFIRVGTDKSIGEEIATTAGESAEKNLAYDPYLNYFYDTFTGFIYLPEYGVFYDHLTGDYYYPEEFGYYDPNFFIDYLGTYGDDIDDYYSYLYNNPDDSLLDPDFELECLINPNFSGACDDLYGGYNDEFSEDDTSSISPFSDDTSITNQLFNEWNNSLHDSETDGVTFAGGAGLSIEDAVIILGATSEMEGISAESEWISLLYGVRDVDWEKGTQSLIEDKGRYYDLQEVYLTGSGETIEIWFDITDFFGKDLF